MPVVDPVLALLPAPEDVPAVELAVEVHQPLVEPLEHATDLLELEQIVVDLVRHRFDLGAEPDLLGRLAPFGLGLRRDELVAGHEIAPLWVQRDDIGHDPLDERERTVCFGEREVLARHSVIM
jgi:hypothetical protein